MAASLLLLARIATMPSVVITMKNMAISTITSSAGPSALDAANRRSSWIFAAYIGVLLVTAGAVAFFTWWTWDAGNRVQDIIRTDAQARIEEAKSTAAQANARSKNLEASNLTLRGQVATLETSAVDAQKDVASLQKAASDAKASQQRVEIDLAKQQERTAIAEKGLANLKLALQPRRLTTEQKTLLVASLKGEPKGEVAISCVMGDSEGNAFATDISAVLYDAGWNKQKGAGQGAYVGGDPLGFGMIVHSLQKPSPHLVRLQRAFFTAGLPLPVAVDPSMPDGTAAIMVGHKPPAPTQ